MAAEEHKLIGTTLEEVSSWDQSRGGWVLDGRRASESYSTADAEFGYLFQIEAVVCCRNEEQLRNDKARLLKPISALSTILVTLID
mmetsp:Transcript_2897/g.5184  ORF Transcript_2897/g.5184 Transcript_2897/m.5184 type:complete len:86 (-) Transcript_2897:30-287(-)